MAKRKAPRRARPAAGAVKRTTAQPARAPAARRRGKTTARKAAGRKATSAKRRSATVAKRVSRPAARVAKRPSARATSQRAGGTTRGRAAAKVKAARANTVRAKVTTKTLAKASAKPKAPARPVLPSKARPRMAIVKAAPVRPAPASRKPSPPPAARRRIPDLNRDRRRVVEDDDVAGSPPSSLSLDRTASSARSGRQELQQRYDQHTETSPALTGGDVDADWESAYAVGDEAPGGDNPTPDQNVVEEIGLAIGVAYEDNEELDADRIEERDRHRWEFDPASSDDFDDR